MSSPDKNLDVNQNIELLVPEGPYQGSYNSKVSDITEDEIMIMSVYKREERIPLRKGLEVAVLYEGDSAFYSLKTEIIDRVRDPIPLLILKKTDEVNRIQRRSYLGSRLIKISDTM